MLGRLTISTMALHLIVSWEKYGLGTMLIDNTMQFKDVSTVPGEENIKFILNTVFYSIIEN